MKKFLAYMVKKAERSESDARRKLIGEAINYVEGLEVFFDVEADDVPAYAKVLIECGKKVKCMRMVIELHREWVRLGSK